MRNESTDHKRTCSRKGTDAAGAHRVRAVDNFRLRSLGHAVPEQWGASPVYLTDAKPKNPPAPAAVAAAATPAELPREPVIRERAPRPEPVRTKFDDLADALREGIRVVTPRSYSRRRPTSPAASWS